MKHINLSSQDKQDISNFIAIVSKPTYTRQEIKAWLSTVTNPAVCSNSNIRWKKRPGYENQMDIRYMTTTLKPVYTEARSKVVAQVKTARKPRAKKATLHTVNDNTKNSVAKDLQIGGQNVELVLLGNQKMQKVEMPNNTVQIIVYTDVNELCTHLLKTA